MIVLTSPGGSEGELVELLTIGQGPQLALSAFLADPIALGTAEGLDGSSESVLELLPAGHAPGIYNLYTVAVRRVAGTGGDFVQTLTYSAPLVGPVSHTLPGQSLSGPAGTPLVVPPVPFFSDGTAPVVLTTVFESPTGVFAIDLYAGVRPA